MGVILCGEHGRSAIALVCEHVAKAVVERRPLPARSAVVADIEGLITETTYCRDCIADGALPLPPARMSGEELERLSTTKLDPVPVCAKCLAVAHERDR